MSAFGFRIKEKNTKCKMKSTLKFSFLYQQQWPAKQTVSSILNFFEDNEVVSKGLFCNNSLIYMYMYNTKITLLVEGEYSIFIIILSAWKYLIYDAFVL